ncbi:MAG: hypothetical protein WD267_05115 [Balneolales bacterium]
MKKLYLVLIAVCMLLTVRQSEAQDRKFGLGVMLGEPTGLSAKLWTSSSNALAFGLGWSTYHPRYDDNGLRIHAHMDYLWHSFDSIKSEEQFVLHYGVGVRFKDRGSDNGSLALRGVGGINWLPRNMPIDVFLELAPSLELTPSTGFGLDAALGARFYF